MIHKLPDPLFRAKCGVCFEDLHWIVKNNRFECNKCLITVKPIQENPDSSEIKYKTSFCDPKAEPCHAPPIDSFKKVRHLRENKEKKRYFAVFSYIFFPCALPKGHTSIHFHPWESRYSEESIDYRDNLPVESPKIVPLEE
jgi:hypothetical protein